MNKTLKQGATRKVSRRVFLQTSTVGLSLGCSLPAVVLSESDLRLTEKIDANQLNAFLTIGSDNTVTVLSKHVEFGQGTYTGMATLLAEELDANWELVTVRSAPANKELYANRLLGAQGTGGSTAIASAYQQMREAGATARAMLVSAAAKKWAVPSSEINVSNGVISHTKSGRRLDFGEIADAAALLPVPTQVTLKTSDQFNLIGKEGVARKDIGKTDGTAIFTQDIQLPGMLTAVVMHPPRFGAKVDSVNSVNALKIKGVRKVVEIPNGVAVVAESFWQAKKGRDALEVKWDFSNAMTLSSDQQMQLYKEAAREEGIPAKQEGDLEKGFQLADKVVEAEFEYPYLAHATMEPMNCVVQINKHDVQVWNGCQSQTTDQTAISKFLEVPLETVFINTLLAGGSFGRRASKDSDYVLEATSIAKAYGDDTPIKMVWTREDDMRAGYFRPMFYHKMKAGIDASGKITAWQHRIVGQQIIAGTRLEFLIRDGIDFTMVEGANELPYSIPNFRLDVHNMESKVSTLWWRSVGSTHNAHSVEAFMDLLASAASMDPLAFRQNNLGDDARHRTVLDRAAKESNWGSKLPEGTTRGLALHKSFGSYVAEVVELSVDQQDKYKVDRVTCVVDCGVAVNPDIIRAQMEGGIGYGLSPALMSKINIENGAVQESNFDRYQVIRIKDMPPVDVHIIESDEPPTGVGEPSTPVIGPAVANALHAYNGKTKQVLPFGSEI